MAYKDDIISFDTFLNDVKTSGAKSVSELDLDKQKELWVQITEEVKKLNEQREKEYTLAKAIQDVTENTYYKEQEALAKEFKRKKEIAALELKIIKVRESDSKRKDKDLKKLEKQLALLKQTQTVEAKTEEILKKYEDERELRKRAKKAQSDAQDAGKELFKDSLSSGDISGIIDGLKLSLTGGLSGGSGFLKSIDTIVSGISAISKKLDKTIEEIVKYKSDWDTRLFGSDSSHSSLTKEIANSIGASPYVKQADVMKNVDEAIKSGIAYNIEQRAFLQTVKDDIATTFDAFDSTLLQIVRIQQNDSTAARLGMEATLNQFLNSMYANTEYLNSLSDTVTSSLYEATSLLTSEQSIGFEYQVQKWLGSLYSVGMSSSAIGNIAQALGKLASGDISGTTTGAGKLLVMSASKAGIDYSDLLTKGINDSEINTLMESMVEYLRTIADSNKVVQSQYASIFGLATSDIVAARNLASSDIANIAKYTLSSSGAINSLLGMGGTISSRMGMGEKLSNALDNLQYTLASNIASNPALYAMWAISGMLDEYMGGINIPAVSVFGNMVDLETTVADLMRVGALGTSLLGGIGSLVNAASASAGESGINGILKSLGVGSASAVTRGSGLNVGLGTTTSGTSYIGNVSGSDVYASSLASAEEQKSQLMIEAQSESSDVTLETINNTALKIYDLLAEVIINGRLRVDFDTLPSEAWTKGRA